MHSIPTDLKETNQTLSLANENGVTTLGLLCTPTTDQLQVRNTTTQVTPTDDTGSKRKIMAITASIFYSLGLLSQAVIAYKTFLQKLWQDKRQ